MQVKIQFGLFKGKILRYQKDHAARPSLARARDVLFNWLGHCNKMVCLDLFAGTGILGLEALSLGATSMHFIDKELTHIKMLQQHVQKMKLDDHCKIFCIDAINWLEQNDKLFDLVFLDPPFKEGWLEKLLALDSLKKCLHNNSLIYIEAERGWQTPMNWNLYKQKKLGDVSIYLLTPKQNTCNKNDNTDRI